ncbi:MAG: hypothetical protein ACK55I_41555, partial [bacterium]
LQDRRHGRLVGRPVHPLGRHMVEGHPELGDQVAELGVVAEDGLDAGLDAAELVADQQVTQAVVLAGGQHHDPLRPRPRQTDPGPGRQGGLGFRHDALPDPVDLPVDLHG